MAKTPIHKSKANIIQASPTKEFFISMLTKDITLIDAIGDLIDNSVDGANQTARLNNLKTLNNFEVKIKATASKFEIEDNCGGIDVDTARKYAFRFGRPSDKEYKIENHSIGQFGIGMKRAFFKIGNLISVSSVAKNSKFETILNVPIWQAQIDDQGKPDWDFPLTPHENLDTIPLKKRGTKISITDLTEDAKNNFDDKEDAKFETNLIDEIKYEHLYNINKGLKIIINGKVVKPPKLSLIYNKEFRPAYWQKTFENGLSVEIVAGISEDKGNEGGWYIFCNDRLITGPDTSKNTGWTGNKGNGADGVALYHDQFYRFRGYVFFNSKDASKLPWNTTKTGIDEESSKYQNVRKQMISMMRPVMTLMNKLKNEKEKDRPESERILNHKVNNAKIVTITDVLKEKKKLDDIFHWPKIKITPQTGMGKISYQKSYSEIDKVKKYFGVTKLGEVGIATFDYFFNHKIGK